MSVRACAYAYVRKVKLSQHLIKYQAMGSWKHILNLSTRWKWVISLMFQLLYPYKNYM
jgi:hypothetical protein